MKNTIYDILARRYDAINGGVDHEAMAEFFLQGAERFSKRPVSALDLCCGTGGLLLSLCRRGIDLTGVDRSADMLAVCRERVAEEGFGDCVLLLCQDMRSFELYGTVDAVTCCLDSVNHLASSAELKKVFALVCNYLEYGGIFYFDVNSGYKYEHIYGDNSYILEDEGLYCGWQNRYDRRSGRAEFFLSIFEEEAEGRYLRTDCVQREKYFSDRVVRSALSEAGLELCGVYGDTDFGAPEPDSERLYYFARRPFPKEGKQNA